MTLLTRKVDYAIRLWQRCMKANEWPMYAPRILTPAMPLWAENSWLQREEAELRAEPINLRMAG